MSVKKNSKRVSFSDKNEIFTETSQEELLQENQMLRGRIAELEQIQAKSEKFLAKYQENFEVLQGLLLKIEELKGCNEASKDIISQLQSENFQIVKMSQKLRAENSELHLKRQILETEVEKLSQTVYNQEIQLRKTNLVKNCQSLNPVYRVDSGVQRKNVREIGVEDKSFKLRPTDVVWSKGKGSKKKPQITVGKMRNLSVNSMSCKSFGTRSFSLAGTVDLNNIERGYHLEELKRLIQQTKDRHYRYKSVL